MIEFDIRLLEKFLVKAHKAIYDGDGDVITPQRPRFSELKFVDGDWQYLDSRAGFYVESGQEVVRFQEEPVWAMAYGGGMHVDHHGDVPFARETFSFLKEALSHVEPVDLFRGLDEFRGPRKFFQNDWVYKIISQDGNIARFKGLEHIFYNGKSVFSQDFMGGLIVP